MKSSEENIYTLQKILKYSKFQKRNPEKQRTALTYPKSVDTHPFSSLPSSHLQGGPDSKIKVQPRHSRCRPIIGMRACVRLWLVPGHGPAWLTSPLSARIGGSREEMLIPKFLLIRCYTTNITLNSSLISRFTFYLFISYLSNANLMFHFISLYIPSE